MRGTFVIISTSNYSLAAEAAVTWSGSARARQRHICNAKLLLDKLLCMA